MYHSGIQKAVVRRALHAPDVPDAVVEQAMNTALADVVARDLVVGRRGRDLDVRIVGHDLSNNFSHRAT